MQIRYAFAYSLKNNQKSRRHNLICIQGAGSVGKTTIARKVCEHPLVLSSFARMLWINNGGLNREYHQVRSEILQQLNLRRDHQDRLVSLSSHDYVSELKGVERILIVIDAVEDTKETGYSVQHLSVDLCVGIYKDFRCYSDGYPRIVLIMTGGNLSNEIADRLNGCFHVEKVFCESRLG